MNTRIVLGILVGGAVGVLLGWAAYAWGSPMMEESSGLLRDAQGLLWNLVPLLGLLGAVAGGSLARRRHPRR